MEMCYDGALIMPKNYAVVNEEEMTYVDGGFDWDRFWDGVASVGCAVATAGMAVVAGPAVVAAGTGVMVGVVAGCCAMSFAGGWDIGSAIMN